MKNREATIVDYAMMKIITYKYYQRLWLILLYINSAASDKSIKEQISSFDKSEIPRYRLLPKYCDIHLHLV